ncbi:MAG: hypothetical protein R3C53_00105 [Pirellulaceae bacterium]
MGLRLLTLQQALEPGENLEFEYAIQRISAQLIERLEVSVAWYTEGKGSEDIGVHFFQSVPRSELSKTPLSDPHRIETLLPANPLSYDGRLFKIRWCVRLRLFLCDGREITAEQPFYLGHLTSEV